MKIRCSQCEQVVGAVNFRGGDGSAVHPRRHLVGGEPCRGQFDMHDLADTAEFDEESKP